MADPTETADSTPKKEDEPRYEVEYHRARARSVYGVSPHAIEGALAGESRKTWTVEQVKAAVKRFDARVIPVDNEGDEEA